ncbi:MAG TPA: flavodoxin family protein [Thermoleophilia bacterium]|nr:flavodoxin family protein [Thermoleophilia bacterium]
MDLKAAILNCTLKKSPAISNTEALINKVIALMEPLGVESEVIRVADYHVPFGVSSDEGPSDEWPQIYEQLKAANIVIIGTPIWFGVRSSVAQLVIERLDGSYQDGDPRTGQFPLYGKVAGVIVTGNEDGAHDAAGTTLFNLSHLGCVVPPNSDTYWVGDAGPGPSYIEAGGDKHLYTNKTARFLAHNVVWMARLLEKHPIPTNLNELIEEARGVSR